MRQVLERFCWALFGVGVASGSLYVVVYVMQRPVLQEIVLQYGFQVSVWSGFLSWTMWKFLERVPRGEWREAYLAAFLFGWSLVGMAGFLLMVREYWVSNGYLMWWVLIGVSPLFFLLTWWSKRITKEEQQS